MSKHLKRLAAPRSWTLKRKSNVYTTKPTPGPHPVARGMPLSTILRDHLKLATSGREARTAVGSGDVRVDGRIVRNSRLPVGFMDAVHVPKVGKAWRVVIDDKSRLRLVEVPEKDAAWKLAQITNKTTVRGGATQLNLHDGRNLIVKKDDYKTGDVLKLEVPAQKIVGHFRFEEGALALVIGGQHAGEIAPVKAIEVTRSHKPNLVHLKGAAHGGDPGPDGDPATFTTIKTYVFPIGERANLPKSEVKRIV
jgi:small subunit ribosomal protein S4e